MRKELHLLALFLLGACAEPAPGSPPRGTEPPDSGPAVPGATADAADAGASREHCPRHELAAPCPPCDCPLPAVCRGAPCFLGQRCAEGGCRPAVERERGLSPDTLQLSLDVSGQGSVVLAGSFLEQEPSAAGRGTSQLLLARLTPEGSFQWSRSWGGEGEEAAAAVAIGQGGDLWVAGGFRGAELAVEDLRIPWTEGRDREGHPVPDAFLLKLMGGGIPVWLQGIGTPGAEEVLGLATGEEGAAFLLLRTDAPGISLGRERPKRLEGDDLPAGGFVLARMLTDGECQWARGFPGTSPVLTVYRDDQLYLAAAAGGTAPRVAWQQLPACGAWLARLDWDGDLVWARALEGDPDLAATALASFEDGDIALAGTGTPSGFPSSQGRGPGWVARLSPVGVPERLLRLGGDAGGLHVATLHRGRDGALHLAGTFSGTLAWKDVVPRPDLSGGLFAGTLDPAGEPAAVLALEGEAAGAARDDRDRLHVLDRGTGRAFRLLALEP